MFVTERRKWLGVKLALLGFAVGVLGFLVARWKFEPGMAIAFAGIALSLVGAVIHRVWLERYGASFRECLDVVCPNRKWLRTERRDSAEQA